jgi:outer membrane protein
MRLAPALRPGPALRFGVAAVALVLSAPSAALAQSADTVTVSLAEAESRALAHNPLLAGAEARIEVNRAQESRAKKARFLPELNLRNSYGVIPKQRGAFTEYGVLVSPDTLLSVNDMSWFTQLDLRLVQPLWTFGKLGRRIEAAGYAVEASEAGLDRTKADVLLMVRQLYWGVVLAQELESAADDVLEKVEEADTTLDRQYEEGTATQNDMFKFQIFQYEVNRRYREVTAGLDQARAGLRAALGLGDGVTVRVATEALDTVSFALQGLPAYLEMARANRPELRELQAGISARRALMVAEQRDAWPTLFFAGSISGNLAPDRYDPRNPFWQNQTNYFRGGGVLGFEWNLNFSQHRADAAVQRTEMIQLESQSDALNAMMEQEVRQAWLKAGRAYTDVAEGRAALQASENWLRAELQTYDIGMSEIKDLIDAFRANAEMKVTQLKNIADFNVAVAELSRRVGLDLSAPAR